MKNFLLSIAMLVIASTLTISCGKKLSDCTELVSKVNAAQITYTTNPSTTNCQAYKTALNDMLGCSVITPQERTAYEQLFNQLTC